MPQTPKSRPTYKGPGAVGLYWQRLGKVERVFLALVALWVVAVFVIPILIATGALPPVAAVGLFVGLAILGGWAQWHTQALRYARGQRDEQR